VLNNFVRVNIYEFLYIFHVPYGLTYKCYKRANKIFADLKSILKSHWNLLLIKHWITIWIKLRLGTLSLLDISNNLIIKLSYYMENLNALMILKTCYNTLKCLSQSIGNTKN